MALTFLSADLEVDLTPEELEELSVRIAELVRKHHAGLLDEPIPDDIVEILAKLDIELEKVVLN